MTVYPAGMNEVLHERIIYGPTFVHETVSIGDKTRIGAFCDIASEAKIGARCNIQAHVTIPQHTIIGDDVFIGPQVTILNDKYPPSHKLGAVKIGNHAIIGGAATLLPGVTIGEYAVVGAASLVTRDVKMYRVVWGSPAEVQMERETYDKQQAEEGVPRVAG